ncbi:SIR2 family protein [Nitrospira sp. MA-1]|nr:SIR2 family protein [Nitrospira sp. MA-1]
MHSGYLRYEESYDKEIAIKLLEFFEYPKFFSYCKSISKQRYHTILSEELSLKKTTPVYERFCQIIQGINPSYILTTNVDGCLETSLEGCELIEKTDIERIIPQIKINKSFICKLHGSISSIESIVFTEEDYKELLSNNAYQNILKNILMESCVVFIGYSMADEYLMKIISENNDIKELFGDGPHFLVSSSDNNNLPISVKTIKYFNDIHADHRSSILVADIIKSKRNIVVTDDYAYVNKKSQYKSSYYISDVIPPGLWTSSYTFVVKGADEIERNMIVGTGFNNSELSSSVSTAMHDLVVGLICFDHIYLPLASITKIYNLFGSVLFWNLIEEDSLRFVAHQIDAAVIYPNKEDITGGDIGIVSILNQTASKPISGTEEIRKSLAAVPGYEDITEARFALLASKIESFENSPGVNIADVIRSSLLYPSVKELLGISDAVIPTSVPKWHVFSVLRVAHIIMAGVTCEKLNIPALKIHFGGNILAGVIFSAVAARNWAAEAASYVVTGRFSSDLGGAVLNDPGLMQGILKFRNTQNGMSLRKEILNELSVNEGGEVVTSIEAGLRHCLPNAILENARDELSSFLLAEKGSKVIPAIWGNPAHDDKALKLWRIRSDAEFKKFCNVNKIGAYDACPCGSGEKLKFCCSNSFNLN